MILLRAMKVAPELVGFEWVLLMQRLNLQQGKDGHQSTKFATPRVKLFSTVDR
jgi:hypothetical protein